MDELARDLRTALDLPIEHLSAYNLTYEPNTAMTARLSRGEFEPADEDTELEMFWFVRRACAERGLAAYEVSNFAREGAECAHNLAYWRQDQWIAAGPSASGHIGGHRYKVIPRLADYLAFDDDGFAPVVDHEPPDAKRLLAERIMTGVRLAEGLGTSEMIEQADSLGLAREFDAEIEKARHQGWLDGTSGRLVLTESGLPLADHVAACLMSAVR